MSGKNSPTQKIIILCGPTAVGKSEVALQLAQRINAEIVMADSQVILKDFNIGTAKPTLEEQKAIPHYLIDVIRFGGIFDAARFASMADQAIQEISLRGKRIIICGGTGLYLKALMFGLMEAPKRDEQIRKVLNERIKEEGLASLYEALRSIDPKRASEIHPNDSIRIIRSLEIYQLSGKIPSAFVMQHRFQTRKYIAMKIGLNRPREELYDRINQRVLKMMQRGWVEEVKGLMDKEVIKPRPISSELEEAPIGYLTLANHLQGKISLKEAIHQIQKRTRQLAKRQLTWFRADKEISWFHPRESDLIAEEVEGFLP